MTKFRITTGVLVPKIDVSGRHHPTATLVRQLLTCVAGSCLVATGSRAQTSGSQAYIYDKYTGTYPCNQSPPDAVGANSANCSSTAITGGTASASATSSNSARTMSAQASLTGNAVNGGAGALASALQYNVINITGAAFPNEQLVFHFLTSQSTIGIGGNYDRTSALWYLYLQSATGSDVDYAYQFGFGDGTQTPITSCSTQLFNRCSYNVAGTASGFDMTLPLTSGNTFGYYLATQASAVVPDTLPAGATLGSSIVAQLQGVDAVNESTYISSASFDPETGLGTIDLTTVPEPSTIVLLSTGLVGLVSIVRYRGRRM